MTNKQIGAYLRRRERRLAKRAKAMSTSEMIKLLIRSKRTYKESNHIFNA